MKKRVWLLIIAVCLVVASLVMQVSAATDGDWEIYYEQTSTGKTVMTIRKYTGNEEHVIIPDRIAGYSPDRLGSGALTNNTTIKTVTVPQEISIIGAAAFANCTNLEKVVLPDKVTVEGTAFSGCVSLREVNFPQDQRTIPSKCFENCSSLTSFVFSESVYEIGYKSFANCTALTEITFYGSVSIEADSFEGVTATAYYYATHWPEEKRQDYGGNLTWVQISDYQIIKDENWENGTLFYRYGGADLSIRVKAPIEDIDYITVPVDEGGWITDKVLDSIHFTLTAVSDTETVLTLKASYLETLPVGEWSNNGSSGVSIYFKDGYRCGTSFRLEKPADFPTQPPATDPPITEPSTCEHQYTSEVIGPSCTGPGYTTYTCSVCGDSFSSDYVDPPGHAYGEWVVVENADYGKAGRQERTCASCGTIEGAEIPPLTTQPEEPSTEPVQIETEPTATEPPSTEPPATELTQPQTNPAETEPSGSEQTTPSQTESTGQPETTVPETQMPTQPGTDVLQVDLVPSLILLAVLVAALTCVVVLILRKNKR